MAANERDFGDFYLGDNVYELANGLVPEIAEKLEVDIADEPSSDDLQAIMQKAGTNKVLRNNEEITAIERDEMADMIERSGVQEALNRSLWTPGSVLSYEEPADHVLAFGGVANWQDRTAALLARENYGAVNLIAGNRLMDTATEVTNPNVKWFHYEYQRYPTEAEYAYENAFSELIDANFETYLARYDTQSADEMIAAFFEKNPQLLEQRLAVARVANAGVVMALQVREAARKLNPDFDADETNPQMFVITDSFPVSRTDEQDSKPADYQKAATALRQVVLVAKKLHEAEV